jgi:TetR/AcrR family fatty acid metabolism transcriptional regulator
MMAQRVSPDFYASEDVQKLKNYSKLVLDVIIAGQEENIFRPDLKPRLIRNMAIGTCIFTVYDSIINNNTFDPHEYSDLIYQLVLDGTDVQNNTNNEKQRTLKRAELRKSQIIETSTRAFSAKGFASTTISDIATQANLGDATLYEYFENKEAILLGIPHYYLKDLGLEGGIQPTDFPEPERRLRRLIWRWIWKLYANEDFSRVLAFELLRNIKFYASPGYKFLESFLSNIREAVKQGQKEGIFRDHVPPRIYSHMILGTIDQYLLSQFLVNTPPLRLSELNVVVDVLVRAIKK